MTPAERAAALSLAEELLADIELGRITVDKQVFKASRLARLVNDERAQTWLGYERLGWTAEGPTILEWKMGQRGREKDEYVFTSTVQLVSIVATLEAQLQGLRIPDVSGDWANKVVSDIRRERAQLMTEKARFERIVVQVSAMVHQFANKHYNALVFTEQQAEMFDTAKTNIDRVLIDLPGEQIRKIESAYRGIRAGDAESISGAMNSVRRLIDAVADALFPATSDTRLDGQGNVVKLGDQQRLNRIKAFIDDHSGSKSRGDRLKRGLSDIHGRVSTAVHNDVTAEEAEYLFLSAYVLLGEVVGLSDTDPGQ
jgi:hypothetical protein